MNRKREIKKVKEMGELELIQYYRKKGICGYFQICPWKYLSLYYCKENKGKIYKDCKLRIMFSNIEEGVIK